MICALMFIISNHYEIKCLSNLLQLEPCNVILNVISDVMAHRYHLWNTIVILIIFCNGQKMICALMFIISNHHEIKSLSNLLQLEPCNVMFKVVSDIWHIGMISEIQLLSQLISSMKSKWFVHWYLLWAIFMPY